MIWIRNPRIAVIKYESPCATTVDAFLVSLYACAYDFSIAWNVHGRQHTNDMVIFATAVVIFTLRQDIQPVRFCPRLIVPIFVVR